MNDTALFEPPIRAVASTTPGQRTHVWILALLAAIILFVDAGINELHGTAVFYASLVREIVDTGDWMRIYADERAYLLKPPLVVWASALSAQVFGLTNFGVTFISRLAGVGCIMLTYILVRRWWSHPVAWVAALALLTNSTFVQFTATLRMDSMLMFGMLLSIAGWGYRHTAWGAPALFGGITIAVLSKGPIGFAAIPLIACHALLLGCAPVRPRGWRWAALLLPIVAWYGALVLLHGMKPFAQLSVDALRASANPQFDLWQSIVAEYVMKPLRRYWPWLPFIVIGAIICGVRMFNRHELPAMRRHYAWVLAWFVAVLAIAMAKPDHDIRYIYLGLPVLGLFAGIAVATLSRDRLALWVPGAVLAAVLTASIVHHYDSGEQRDTRTQIAAIRHAVAGNSQTLAIGGFPVPPLQARRQNTHRDWIYFYTATVPRVLSWEQAQDASVDFSRGVFLTNSHGHEKRLEEFNLAAKYVTTEMIFALPQ